MLNLITCLSDHSQSFKQNFLTRLFKMRNSVACALQRGNSKIIRAGLLAASRSNAKYVHKPHTSLSIQQQSVALFKHVVRSYDLREYPTRFVSPSITIPRPQTHTNEYTNENDDTNEYTDENGVPISRSQVSRFFNVADVDDEKYDHENDNNANDVVNTIVNDDIDEFVHIPLSSTSNTAAVNTSTHISSSSSSASFASLSSSSSSSNHLPVSMSSHPHAMRFLNELSINVNNSSSINNVNDTIIVNNSANAIASVVDSLNKLDFCINKQHQRFIHLLLLTIGDAVQSIAFDQCLGNCIAQFDHRRVRRLTTAVIDAGVSG